MIIMIVKDLLSSLKETLMILRNASVGLDSTEATGAPDTTAALAGKPEGQGIIEAPPTPSLPSPLAPIARPSPRLPPPLPLSPRPPSSPACRSAYRYPDSCMPALCGAFWWSNTTLKR